MKKFDSVKWFLRFMAVGAIIAFLILLAAYVFTPKAKASYAEVYVTWGGAHCIDMRQATGEIITRCGGSASFDGTTGPGRTIGIDPIMGNADWIDCSFFLDGELEWTDSAYRGDGTDVNCILDIYSKNGRWT